MAQASRDCLTNITTTIERRPNWELESTEIHSWWLLVYSHHILSLVRWLSTTL
jgi:hypothetical protein